MPRTLVTSALPYANGPLHLGHLAGAYLPADVYVRYLRSAGRDVLWVCGSDEHGAAISMRAKREGRTEQSIIDTYHALNRDAFAAFGIDFDVYHRTSAPLHHETSRELFAELVRRGDQFEERTTDQYYDPEADAFLADRFIQGTCPNCGSPDAYGDQCENCGKDLSPTELIDPRSTISGATPQLRTTKHWYFRLDAHEEWLKEYIERGRLSAKQEPGSHHDARAWRNHVVGQCKSWLEAGLQPRAFTRDLDWGIPVPEVPGYISAADAEGKVLYVWFDAPIGYISATKAYFADAGFAERRQARGHAERHWEDYWKSPGESRLVHFIGKDNIVFHCLTFQATLRALGEDWNISENVPANQFLNFEGRKFSKSRGIGITMDEYLAEFAEFPNHVDAMRWALLRGAPENKDADFTWDDFVEYHDKELADKLGNFVNRVVVLTHKYYGGTVPEASSGSATEAFSSALDEVGALLEGFELKEAAARAMAFVDWANQDLQERAPWKVYKVDPDGPAVAEALAVATQAAGLIRVLFAPFLPATAERIGDLLGVPDLSFARARSRVADGKPLVAPGTRLGESEILFAKIHDRKDDSRLRLVDRQRERLATAVAALDAPAGSPTNTPPMKDEIAYDDFAKLDIRTATIVGAEKMPKADKLLVLEVDLGHERRTVVSGIAQHYDPVDLPGTNVLLLANLAPRKLRGVESQGMILMAETADGRLEFVAPAGDAPAGSPVG